MRFASLALLSLACFFTSVVVSNASAQNSGAAVKEHPLIADVKTQLGDRSVARPFIMIIDLTCVDGKRPDFIAAMSEAIVGTRKEEGNIRYQLINDPADSTKFQMIEYWKNLDALLAHMKQPYIATLEGKLADLLDGEIKLKVMVPIFVKK